MPFYNKQTRRSGILAHPTLLPNNFGIGDFGPSAYNFADFLSQAKQSVWQILPLTPSCPSLGNSPYSSFSAFAGNPLLISPELMFRDNWISQDDLNAAKIPLSNKIDFITLIKKKEILFKASFKKHKNALLKNEDFILFLNKNATWLNDYALFMAAKKHFKNKVWVHWPEDLISRQNSALEKYGLLLQEEILEIKFLQFLFFKQLAELKSYLKEKNIYLIGDVSIYINHDSSDLWTNQHLFYLDNDKKPNPLAGVPPDYYSKTGQLWGNPIFNWPEHKKQNYAWWKSRLQHNLNMYDWLRIDHFLAFQSYWAVPNAEKTAINGKWEKGPGADFFTEIEKSQIPLNFIAEDLGLITEEVTKLRKQFKFPGMRVLHFAFNGLDSSSIHMPFKISKDNLAYTGTHDNNTSLGWYNEDINEATITQLSSYVGYKVKQNNISQTLIRLAWLSSAAIAICNIPDLLNLNQLARFNIPGTGSNNWNWRLEDFTLLNKKIIKQLKDLTALADRV